MSNLTDNFKKITGYDIQDFLNKYVEFTEKHYANIVNYYQGGTIVQSSFNYLDQLFLEIKKIDSVWEFYQNFFNTVDYWQLIDIYSDIKNKLWTVNNLSKWLRSSRSDRFSSNVVVNYVQKQGDNMERISQKTGSIDKDNDWVDLSINNDLNEEKYTSQGGTMLRVRLLNNFNFDISNIVDSLTEYNLYGKDIKNKIIISGGDVLSLEGEESLIQTLENIFQTTKGSIPEFPEDGVDSNLVGSNINIFNYPAQFRNLMRMLQKDDRFKSLELLDVKQKDDMIQMEMSVTTKIGDTFKQDLAI